MRRTLWLLLAFLLPACSGSLTTVPAGDVPANAAGPFPFSPEPPPSFRSDGFRLATLNAEFLFDGVGDEGQATFPHKSDPAAARAHRDQVGAVIRMLDADVVVLQEVEDEATVQLLVEESLDGFGYEVAFVQGTDTFTGQDVAVLSRVPVEEAGRSDARANVGGSRDTYGVSKNLFVRLTAGEVPLTVVGLHFLARPDDPERKPRREAQAEVIRQLVADELAAGRAVAVLGDFNDFDDAVPDVRGNQPISDVMRLIKSAGPGPEDDLRNVIGEVPPHERFTNFWDRNDDGDVDEGEFSAIDHVLLSPALYRRLQEVTYVQAHDPTADGSTDHFPIVVTLDL